MARPQLSQDPLLIRSAPKVSWISAADDGSVWALNTSGRLLQNSENLEPWTQSIGELGAVAAASDGTACGIGPGGLAYVYDDDNWVQLSSQPGVELVTISTPGTGIIYATDANGNIHLYNPGPQTWTGITGPNGNSVQEIHATSDGALFCLSSAGVFSYDAPTWNPLAAPPETLTGIDAGAESWVWGVGKSGTIYQYDASASTWQTIPGLSNGDTPDSISCGDDMSLWVLGTSGRLYQFDFEQYDESDPWEPLPALPSNVPAAQFSVGSLRNAWVVVAPLAPANTYQFSGGMSRWSPVSGVSLTLSQISSASQDNIWAIASDQTIYQLESTGGEWSSNPRPPLPSGKGVAWISAAPDGTVWALDSEGSAYVFVPASSSWSLVTNAPAFSQISVASASVIAGLASDTVYVSTSEPPAWQPLGSEGLSGTLTSISTVGQGGGVFAVCNDGSYYFYLEQWFFCGQPGQPENTPLIAISAGQEVWGIARGGYPLQILPGDGWLEGMPYAVQASGRGGPEWTNDNPFNEALSTHLWIVNRAAQLASLQGSAGQQVCNLIAPGKPSGYSVFHDNLCQGLYDADYLDPYTNPFARIKTYVSHFYNYTTGLNYFRQSSPTAVTNGVQFFNTSVAAYPGDMATAGYNFGLALHYLTDLTQPMHATNFNAFSSFYPRYHVAFENYTLEIQGTVAPPSQYTPSNLNSAESFLVTAGTNSQKNYFAKIVPGALIVRGQPLLYNYRGFTSYWKNIAKANLPGILRDAIAITAQFMVFWMQTADQNPPLSAE